MVIYPLLVSFSITTNITVAFICSSDVQSPKLRVFDVGANQVVVAKARQFLHKLDHQFASGNQQQQLALMKNLAWMSDNAYEDVDSLKMPFVVSKRGRPSTTKRLPLAVERASQELKKEKKTKLELAKEQHGAASRGLKSTSLNAKAAGIVNQTQTMLNWNISCRQRLQIFLTTYRLAACWIFSILLLMVIAASELWPKLYMVPKKNGKKSRRIYWTYTVWTYHGTKKSMALTSLL